MGLGSNLGDTESNMAGAARAVEALDGVTPAGRSLIWLTEPQGFRDQPWFANQVLALDCSAELNPHDLLACLLQVETRLGRVRPAQGGLGPDAPPSLRFSPRPMDLDLLLFGSLVLDTPDLILPHPRMHRRAFVLVPLLELDPHAVIPGRGRADAILEGLDYRLDGRRIHQA